MTYILDNLIGANNTDINTHTADVGGIWSYPDATRNGSQQLDGSFRLRMNGLVESWATNAVTAASGIFDQKFATSFLMHATSKDAILGVACRVDTAAILLDGVIARYAGTSDGVGQWQLFESTAGVQVQIGSNATATVDGSVQTVELDCVGTTASLYINGTLVKSGTIAGTHASPSATMLGFGVYAYTGTGTDGLKVVGPITCDNYGNGAYVGSLSVETRAEGNEVCWTPTAAGTSYHVLKSTNGGGSYSDVATILAAAEPRYLDAGVTNAYLYKVVGYIGTSAADASPAATARGSVTDASLALSTILERGPGRHNLMVDSSGNFLAIDKSDFAALIKKDPASGGNLFTQSTVTSGGLEPGPLSDPAMYVLHEHMMDTTFSESVIVGSPAGGITQTFTGNVLAVSGASNCGYNTYHGPTAFQFGCAAFIATLGQGATGRFGIGLGADRSNGIFMEYNSISGSPVVAIIGRTSGTPTTILAGIAISNAHQFEIAMELFHASFNHWVSTNNAWTRAGGASVTLATTYDIRTQDLTSWLPCFYFGSGSGDDALSMRISSLTACYYNGEGYCREAQFVTWPDGTPYEQDGLPLLSIDKTMRHNGELLHQYTMHAVYRYDPIQRRIVGKPLAVIGAKHPGGTIVPGGMPAATQDNKIIFNPSANGFDIFFNSWSTLSMNGSDNDFKVPFLYHQLWSGALSGPIYLDNPTKVTFPGSFASTETIYGVDAMYVGGAWRVFGTFTNNSITTWQNMILTGASLTALSTLSCYDGTAFKTPYIGSEGSCLFRLGDRYFGAAGSINIDATNPDGGTICLWQFNDDFTAMTPIGRTVVSTTVTAGATSATQTVGKTTGMQVGMSLKFGTSGIVGVIASITDIDTVVMRDSLTTTTSETVTSLNLLSYPNPNSLLTSANSLPQQPAFAVFGNGLRGELHLIGQDDGGGPYANMGNVHVYVAGLLLDGWELPRRSAQVNAGTQTITITSVTLTSTTANFVMTSEGMGWTLSTVFSLVGESPATITIQSAGTNSGNITINFGSPANKGPFTVSDGTNTFTLPAVDGGGSSSGGVVGSLHISI